MRGENICEKDITHTSEPDGAKAVVNIHQEEDYS
jgi:hypothetical protein